MKNHTQTKEFMNNEELLSKLNSSAFRDQLKRTNFILTTDAGSDCDDIFTIDVLLAHGLKPKLIITTHHHPSEKMLELIIHLFSREIYDIPVVPGLGFGEDGDQSAEAFQADYIWWPTFFGYPDNPDNRDVVVAQHYKNYAHHLGHHASIMQKALEYCKRLASNKNAFIDAVKRVAERAIATRKSVAFLSLAPLTCEAEILRSGALDGANVLLAVVMNGGFMLKSDELELERVGYNYMMDPESADYFFEHFPGTVLVVTSEICRQPSTRMPDDVRVKVVNTLLETDVGRGFEADIDLFHRKKFGSGLLPLADCYAGYFATHLEDIESVWPVNFRARLGAVPEPGEHFLNVKPEKVVVLEEIPRSNVFFIRKIVDDCKSANQNILASILDGVNAIHDFSTFAAEFEATLLRLTSLALRPLCTAPGSVA